MERRHAIFLTAAALGMSGAADASALEGQWGGPDAMLTIDAQGGELRQSCAGGRLTAFRIKKDGSFTAKGDFEAYGAGPQVADGAAAKPARYAGRLAGETMLLTVTAQGSTQKLELTKGRRVKLIRCY
ncbi:hypothetical protein HJG53_09600 [Sphingomonas sp. ID1715]|uniref:hypothetical protein n=1 Tax=Sphingomonas sp. ID1715 TaxID=1656898 RepID=UPI0014879784|nr:hypothetical protein [Sphingomonas sp. ID1715]NNM77155.1 hypothetical protein [Sphingomonas sp. ID1715]